MTISGCYAEVKNYEFLEQDTLHQGSVFGREHTTDQDCGFSLECGQFKDVYNHIYTARQ